MAFPVTLNGRTYTLADFSGTNYVEGFPDALQDFVTQAGNIYTTTSTSSVAIGTGSKTFTVADSGKPYTVGTPLRISDAAAPATNWIDGIVTSYSGTTLVVNAVAYAGSGTISSWNINIGGSAIAYTGTLPVAQGGTGATTEAAARTNLDVYSKSEADSRFLNVSGEASDVTMNGNVTIGDAGTDTLTVNAAATMADATLTTADINGGTIDGTVIGGTTPAAISGTTGTFSGDLTIADKIVHDGDTNTALRFPAADTVTVETAGSERVRVDSSGNLLVGTSVGSAKAVFNAATLEGVRIINDSGAARYPMAFQNGATTVGSIQTSTTTTSYNTASDYRLKEDVQPMVGASDRLMALKPVNFAWKINGSRVDGFLAHEVQEVVPECVTGQKDEVDDEGNAVYQGIDQSKLVPLLAGALQEALADIATLKAEVAALKGEPA